MARLLATLFLFCMLAVATAGQALAHAALTSASPADGAVLARAPTRLTLSFSEPVSPLVLTLVGPDGAKRSLALYRLEDRSLVIEAPPALGDGTHVLSWRVVSEDGHPVGGAVVFSVGAPSTSTPVGAPQAEPAVRIMLWLGKVGLYLGLFLGVGGAAFSAWVAPLPPMARRAAAAAILLGLAALPPAFAAQGLDALAMSPENLFDPAVWQAAAGSSVARTLVIAAAAFLLGLASLVLRAGFDRVVAMLALLGAGLALAASGHASAASPQALMRPAVALHGLAIAAWAGALVPLMVALRGRDASHALARFARRIPWIVALLLASGVVLAIVQVETPGALVATAYGRVLLAKLALVAVLFGFAGWNRFRLTARAGGPAVLRRLRRVIAGEIVLMLLVFGTAALWRFTPPPRALAIAASRPASVHIHTPQAMADITVKPGRAGPVALEIVLMNGEFGPLVARELRVALANPAAGIEAIERPATLGEDGIWRVSGLGFPVAGRWTIELEILISDFEMLRLGETVEIGP